VGEAGGRGSLVAKCYSKKQPSKVQPLPTAGWGDKAKTYT